jgi:peptidoglycan-associated lipoprotein
MLERWSMKALILVAIIPSLVAASPATTRDPDFVDTQPRRGAVDRSLAASTSSGPIEPTSVVTFAFDSTALDPASIVELDQVARWMKHHPAHRLIVEGHTDVIGTIDYNLDLGKRRAMAVRDHLQGWGISGDRVIVAVFGKVEAHRRADPSDRRVVLFASSAPASEISALMIDHTRADTIVWTDHGSQLEETRTVTALR